MIGSINGTLKLKTDKYAIVEAGGVGYKISLSPDTLSKLGKETSLWIHTHVREDALELYGFIDRPELEFFEMLMNVPGIGPKSALGILSIATVENLRRAVSTGDTAYLTRVSGIGEKTAEKIVLELRDKLETVSGGTPLREELDVLEALRSLGYRETEAREALKKVSATGSANGKIKEALKILGGK